VRPVYSFSLTPTAAASRPFVPTFPRLGFDHRERPEFKLVLVPRGEIERGLQVLRTAHHVKGEAQEGIFHPLFNEADGGVGDINPDPLPPQLLRGVHGSAAAAEGTEHHIALVGGGGDDAFEQREGLLGGVRQPEAPAFAEG
jgi:hypothetical protein